MKNAILLLSALVLGGGAGAVSSKILAPPAAVEGASSEASELADTVGELTRTIAELRAKQERLEGELAAAKMMAPVPAATRAPEISQADLERAVASYLEENGLTGRVSAPAAAEDSSAGSPVAAASLAELMDMLTDGQLRGLEEEELWEAIRQTGRMDEVLAEYERLAEMHPNNPDVQADLGTAYIQKIFEVGNGPLAGKYGTLADQAFDRALEADPEHWEARFTKAVSLSNWPEFLGKTGEAISEFETLIAQQETRQARPEYASTYFILGNMYQRKGDTEAALEVWRKGLALFPDNETLRDQIRVNE